MRVFISSTVYDLIDVRSEITEQLRELNVVPVLSDDKLSDFRIQHNVNSIETCLVNLESCDEIIILLDRRYGPKLGDYYQNISATHLEYRHAVKLKKPIHMYVRDKLEAEFSIWKRNKNDSVVDFTWVPNKETDLFKLIDEHRTLKHDAESSNWYSTFSTSIDLKAAINKYFKQHLLPLQLTEAIQNNNFPILDFTVESEAKPTHGSISVIYHGKVTNIGGAPAFNCRIYWEKDEPKHDSTLLLPGQATTMTIQYRHTIPKNLGLEQFLIAQYDSAIGISVYSKFRLTGRIHQLSVISGTHLCERRFKQSHPPTFDIDPNTNK